MIALDLAPSARRDEPKWWAHLGEKQRGDRRQGQARAAPAENRFGAKCSERKVTGVRDHARDAVRFLATS